MLVITRGYCLAHIATQEKLAKLLKLRMKKKLSHILETPIHSNPKKRYAKKYFQDVTSDIVLANVLHILHISRRPSSFYLPSGKLT